VSRLEESELLTAFELTALSAAKVATLEAALPYLAKRVAATLYTPPAPEAGKGIEMLLEGIVVTQEVDCGPHLLYLLGSHRAPKLLGRIAHCLGVTKALAAIKAAVSQ